MYSVRKILGLGLFRLLLFCSASALWRCSISLGFSLTWWTCSKGCPIICDDLLEYLDGLRFFLRAGDEGEGERSSELGWMVSTSLIVKRGTRLCMSLLDPVRLPMVSLRRVGRRPNTFCLFAAACPPLVSIRTVFDCYRLMKLFLATSSSWLCTISSLELCF